MSAFLATASQSGLVLFGLFVMVPVGQGEHGPCLGPSVAPSNSKAETCNTAERLNHSALCRLRMARFNSVRTLTNVTSVPAVAARTVPDPLVAGEPGILEVRIAPPEPLLNLELRVQVLDPGVTIEPERQTMTNVGITSQPPVEPEENNSDTQVRDPPALPVVPISLFRIRADRPGAYHVLIELIFPGGRTETSVNIQVQQ